MCKPLSLWANDVPLVIAATTDDHQTVANQIRSNSRNRPANLEWPSFAYQIFGAANACPPGFAEITPQEWLAFIIHYQVMNLVPTGPSVADPDMPAK